MKKFFVLVVFVLIIAQLKSQKLNYDSLLQVVKSTNVDTTRINTLNKIILYQLQTKKLSKTDTLDLVINESKNLKYWNGLGIAYKNKAIYFYFNSNLDSALKYYDLAIENFKKVDDFENIAKIYNNIGLIYRAQSNYPQAIEYYKKAIEYFKQTKDQRPIMAISNNLATVYTYQGDMQRALEVCFEGLKVFDNLKTKETEDSLKLAHLSKTIAIIYMIQKKYKEAEEYYNKSLKFFEKLKSNNDIADIYTNFGTMYGKQAFDIDDSLKKIELYKKELIYYKKAIPLYNKKDKIALSIYNIASAYLNFDNFDSAYKYIEKAKLLYWELKDEKGLALCDFLTGNFLYKNKEFKKAIEPLNNSLEVAEKIGELNMIEKSSNYLYKCYKELGDYKNALVMLEFQKAANDSLFNKNNEKKLTELALTYEFEKEKQQTELKYQEEIKRQKLIQKFSFALVILFLIILIAIYYAFRLKKKKNEELQRLNAEIIMQKEEIEAQRDEIEGQKNQIELQAQEIEKQRDLAIQRGNELEKKNQDIEASIYYALRIQQALLPCKEVLKPFFSNSTIYYKPRDIVSGDFYWFAQRENIIYVAAADCTGHGVPGAFMSLLGISFFNQIFAENPEIETNDFLNNVRKMIIGSLKQSNDSFDSSRDGMDMSLIRFDKNTYEIQYSGAYNSIFVISKNSKQSTNQNLTYKISEDTNLVLTEFKADRMPIGIYLKLDKDFSTHSFELEKGDKIFMFSDGFEDMFNKEQSQKYTAGRFKNLLLQSNNQTLDELNNTFERVFVEWNNGSKQIDDILIIALEV